jgi:toxin ParE1/3/4
LDAVNDLDGIFDYISNDNRNAAVKVLERLEKTILSLRDNPRLGNVVSFDGFSLLEQGYRKIVVKPYIIFYRTGDTEIYISRVLHSKQDWLHLLFESHINPQQ